MPWISMSLRGAKVLARCDANGRPLAEGGRVEVRYKRDDGRAYRAGLGNLKPLPDAEVLPDDHCANAEPVARKDTKPASKSKSKSKAAKPSAEAPAHPDGAIIVYADGACSGNPGPAGLGVVVIDDEASQELSEYLGRGTNNIAELTAILRAAELLSGRDRPIHIYTDSRYSIGVLTQGWKAKKNPELIASAKRALAALKDVHIHYVPGHAGVALNEVADSLAREAVDTRATSGWRPRS